MSEIGPIGPPPETHPDPQAELADAVKALSGQIADLQKSRNPKGPEPWAPRPRPDIDFSNWGKTEPADTEIYDEPAVVERDETEEDVDTTVEITEIEGEESEVSYGGLRRAIAGWRLRRAEERIPRLGYSRVVRGELAEATLQNRIPHERAYPETFSERRAALKASRRTAKIVKHEAEKIRLRGTYGSADGRGRPFNKNDRPFYEVELGEMKPDGTRNTKVVVKQHPYIADQSGEPIRDSSGDLIYRRENDLGTPEQKERLKNGRYTRRKVPVLRRVLPGRQVESELSAAKRFNKHDRKAQKIRGQINRTIDGNDIPGNVATRRINRKANRIDRLESRIEKLDENGQKKQEKKAERQEERKQQQRVKRQQKNQKRQEREAWRQEKRRGIV